MPGPPFQVFICYAREDRHALEQLMGHLAVFERNGTVKFWYDREITGGKDWDQEIRFNLKSADIVLLLISPDFFKSDYIHSVELTEALQRDRDKEALVVPVILKKCLWHKYAELARLQALPAEARPVFDRTHWTDPDDGFYDVAEGFDRIVEDPDTEARRARKRKRLEAEEAARLKREAEETARKKREAEEEARKKHEAEEAARKKREQEEAARKEREAEEARRKFMPDMVLIKGGTFQMGDVMGDGEYSNETVHPVTLSDYYIGRYAVTFDEYDTFCAETGRKKPGDEGWGRGRRPVIYVNWHDAVAYCNWLSEKNGLDPVYTVRGEDVTPDWSAGGFRLPTEAEWEYAAREGGRKVRFGNGKDIADPREINFDGRKDFKKPYSIAGEYRKKTIPVGSLNSPNALGLHDMSGNVYEWCWDWYGAYPGTPEPNPAGPDSGSYRVCRGGSWNYVPQRVRVALRSFNAPGNRFNDLGFRLARAVR